MEVTVRSLSRLEGGLVTKYDLTGPLRISKGGTGSKSRDEGDDDAAAGVRCAGDDLRFSLGAINALLGLSLFY